MEESGAEPPEQKTIEADVQRECDPCKERGKTVTGLHFCLDCLKVYCKSHVDYHTDYKNLNDHILIDIREMSAATSRSDLFKSFTKCPTHPDNEVQFHCKDHDTVFCIDCFNSTHRQCDINVVSNHGNDTAKLTEDFGMLMLKMRTAVNDLKQIIRIREENKNTLKTKMNETRERIGQLRNQVVKLMDDVVNHVSEVTKKLEVENEDRLDSEVKEMSKVKTLTEEKVDVLDTIRQHGSERHHFISTHLMKTQVGDIGRKISEEGQRLRTIAAKIEIGDEIRKLVGITDVEKLVQVKTNETESSHEHIGDVSNYPKHNTLVRDAKHTVRPKARHPRRFSDAKTESSHRDLSDVSNYTKHNTLVRGAEHTVRPNAGHSPRFWDVSKYDDGRVILSDYCGNGECGYLCLYNPADKTMQKLKLNSPYSATQIDDTRIAVSIPRGRLISIVTVGNELQVDKTLKTQYTPHSIVALKNGQLVVAWRNPAAFGVIDISGTELVQKSYFDQDKNGRMFKSFKHMTVDENRQHVIQPCDKDMAVYCFDFTAQPVFRYINPELKEPRGVALDKYGNIYACDKSSTSIHQLTPEGELIRIFTKGVPDHPCAIGSDATGTGFFVTQLASHDKVLYFKLEHDTET